MMRKLFISFLLVVLPCFVSVADDNVSYPYIESFIMTCESSFNIGADNAISTIRQMSGFAVSDTMAIEKMLEARSIYLYSEINEDAANIIQSLLLYYDQMSNDDIWLYINSPGGQVYSGLGIYDTMQYIVSNVITINTGMAASMAAILLVAGQKGKRFAFKHSRVMLHQPMGGLSAQASDIEITSREILKLKQELFTIISEHSGQPYDKVHTDCESDFWMTAEEALEYGIIDKIVDSLDQIINQ